MTTVEIVNAALLRLGIPPVTSLDEDSNGARLGAALFPVCRDRVLRDHCWGFAFRGADLAAVADEVSPDPAYPDVYALPADLIRIIDVNGDQPFRRSGSRLLTTGGPIHILYSARVENSELLDPICAEALTYLLAAEIGMSNVRDAGLVNWFRQQYQATLAEARAIDSQENRHAVQPRPKRSRWLTARYGR